MKLLWVFSLDGRIVFYNAVMGFQLGRAHCFLLSCCGFLARTGALFFMKLLWVFSSDGRFVFYPGECHVSSIT